jgi:hypothetical protein
MQDPQLIDELTETTARNLSEAERQRLIEKLKKEEGDMKTGLADPESLVHVMVFESEKSFFLRWANNLKAQHYLGVFPKPISKIQEHIQIQVGKMSALSADKRENIRTHLYKILPNEFREQQDPVKNSQENTSTFRPVDESIIYTMYSLSSSLCKILKEDFEKMETILQNEDIRADFENIVEWDTVAMQCSTLIQLQKTIREHHAEIKKMHEDLADAYPLQQIADNLNFRKMVDTTRYCIHLVLDLANSFSKDAHKLAIVPRQYQRTREREEDWPARPVETVIREFLGSTMCPFCHVDLITKDKYFGMPPDEIFAAYQFRDKKFKIPDKYKLKGYNPIEIASKVFEGKLKLVPLEA